MGSCARAVPTPGTVRPGGVYGRGAHQRGEAVLMSYSFGTLPRLIWEVVERLGRSDDVARAVMFFCDRANGFVTGQTLYVCGGASVGTIVI